MALNITLPVASWHPNPLDPSAGMEISYEPLYDGEVVAQYLERMGWDDAIDNPSAVYVDGRHLGREEWLDYAPSPMQRLYVHAVAAGGEGSDAQRTILTLAVMAAAIATSGAITGVAGAFAGAAVSVGGQLLINQFYPIEDSNKAEDNKVYDISASQNQLRAYQPLPIVCGKLRVYPDIDEKPYTYFVDNEQYLNQCFNFGLGDLSIEEERSGDTPLDDLVITNYIYNKQTVDNYDTVEGSELAASTGWVNRTSPEATTEISVDITGVITETKKDGGFIPQHVSIEVQYRKVGTANWASFSGSSIIGYGPPNYEIVPYDHTNPNPPPGSGWELVEEADQGGDSGGVITVSPPPSPYENQTGEAA